MIFKLKLSNLTKLDQSKTANVQYWDPTVLNMQYSELSQSNPKACYQVQLQNINVSNWAIKNDLYLFEFVYVWELENIK